jgi:hypothetical protein
MFTIVPEHVWILTPAVNDVRRQALLSTPYEDIVATIVSRANVGKLRAERNKKSILGHPPQSLKRSRVEIRLPCNIVDLFHNGAGGYRAQFYESIQLGEEANEFCRNKILALVKFQETKKDPLAAASLSCETAKVWIGQGRWLHQKWKCLRNLQVPRWSCDPEG